jgi:DNA gyrase subunit A
MRNVVADELIEVKADYVDHRRTQIISVEKGKAAAPLTASQLLPEETVWVGITADGLVSRTRDAKKAPRPSGNEAPRWLVKANTTDTLYLVSKSGKTAAIPVHTLPQVEKLGEGTAWHKVSPLRESDALAAAFSLPANRGTLPEETYVFTVSRGGMVKKSLASELPGPSAQAFTLVKANTGDSIRQVMLTDGTKDILLAVSSGFAIRFNESDVRSMGLVAAGVNGVKLGVGDEVTGAEVVPAKKETVFLITSDGKAKRVPVTDFPTQGRYGRGVIGWSLPKGVTLAGLATGKPNLVATVHLLKMAPKSTRLDAGPVQKRAAVRGGQAVDVKAGDAVTFVTTGWEVEKTVKLVEVKKPKPRKTPAKKGKAKKPAARKKAAARKTTKRKTTRKNK